MSHATPTRWPRPSLHLLVWLAIGLLVAAVGISFGFAHARRQAAGTLLRDKGTHFAWRPRWFARWLPGSGLALFFVANEMGSARMEGPAFGDEDIERLLCFETLQRLSLDKTSITGAGASRLGHFKALERLTLRSARISDGDLAGLAELARLQHLDLSYSTVSDAAIEHIARLTDLRTLGLNRTRITDKALSRLATLPLLERLEIDGTRITDAGLAEIPRFPALRWLSIEATAVTDAGLAHLAGPRLTVVELGGNDTTPQGIARLETRIRSVRVEPHASRAQPAPFGKHVPRERRASARRD